MSNIQKITRIASRCAPRKPLVAKTEATSKHLRQVSAGYGEVNGMMLYHEMRGEGGPLILLPGGLMTIGEMAPLILALAGHRQVIAVELQGHGRTADTDRPLKLEIMGDDIAALIEPLGLGQTDIVGYSLGGDVALRTAIQHPDRVRRQVVLSPPFARNGWYPKMLEAAEGMPGFVSFTTFRAEDGERVPVIEFVSAEALRAWRQPPEHRKAQELGRAAFYAEFQIQVCSVIRQYGFKRSDASPAAAKLRH
jgi:pimeloyl-ACP methyl ester carboxylesterase